MSSRPNLDRIKKFNFFKCTKLKYFEKVIVSKSEKSEKTILNYFQKKT